jgi:hypothetical protein
MVSRMVKHLGALGLLLPISAYAQDLDEGLLAPGGQTNESSAPIINGDLANDDDYPMAGALLYAGSGFKAVLCSSTLIAPDVVLLAAHCVDPNALSSLGYSGGTSYWSPEPDLEIYDGSGDPPLPDDAVLVKASVFPDEFDINTMQPGMALALNHDIALSFLDEPLEDQPLGVVPTDDEAAALATGAAVSVVGWGQTSQGGPAGVKYWGESVVGAISDYEFQVGPNQDDVRQCHGDSGGPTFFAVETGSATKERVVGVTSQSWDATDCASVGGVETRVDHYLDWIDDAMSDACADGTRTWCDEPGILPPPTGARTSSANIGDGIRVAPICGTVVPGSGAFLAALSMLLAGARRSRTQERGRRR